MNRLEELRAQLNQLLGKEKQDKADKEEILKISQEIDLIILEHLKKQEIPLPKKEAKE